jgi:Undecaprenyl-phosphate glucose phosphotransferase
VPSEIVSATLAIADCALVASAAAAAYALYFSVVTGVSPEPARYVLTALLAAVLFIAIFERQGGYRANRLTALVWQSTRVVASWTMTVGIVLLVAFVGKISQDYSRGWMLAWAVGAGFLLLTGRGVLWLALSRWLPPGCLARNVAIVGTGSEAGSVVAKLQQADNPGVNIRGLYDDRPAGAATMVGGLAVLGTVDDLIHTARRDRLDEVVVALPLHDGTRLAAVLDKLKQLPIDLRLSIEPLAQRFDVRGVNHVGRVPVLEIVDRPLKSWRAVIKWVEDKVLAAICLIWLAPLMAVIAIVIKLDSRGPVLFIQERFGFNNNIIRVFKFRTMRDDRCDPSGAARTVQDDPRVTRVGRVLRWLSLDELPQLLNVLRGDMSLVGPRPHAIAMRAGGRLYGEAVELYFHRHRVKPGITGWAQVSGLRGEVDTLAKAQARVEHDLYYIEHWSPWFDLKILLMTVGLLVAPNNAY